MEAKIRNLFSRKSNFAQSYETAVACQPPVKGTYPASGNGLGIETLRLGRTGRRDVTSDVVEEEDEEEDDDIEAAVPPPIARHRGLSDATQRPRTATWSGSANRMPSFQDRLTSVSFVKAQPMFPRKQAAPVSSQPAAAKSFTQRPRSHSVEKTRPGTPSSHIDLLDAQDRIKPGTRKRASTATGFRSYGEDIADRNIGRFGGGAGHDSHHYTYSALGNNNNKARKDVNRDPEAVAGAGAGVGAGAGAGAGAGVDSAFASGAAGGPDARLGPLYDDGAPEGPPSPHIGHNYSFIQTFPRRPHPPHSSRHSQSVDDDTIHPCPNNGDDGGGRRFAPPIALTLQTSSCTPARRGPNDPPAHALSAAVNSDSRHRSSSVTPSSHHPRDDDNSSRRRPLRSPYSSASIYAPDLPRSCLPPRPATAASTPVSNTRKSPENTQPITMKDTMRDVPLGKRPAGKSASSGPNVSLPPSATPTRGASVAAASALSKHPSTKQTSLSTNHDRSFPMSSYSSNKDSSEAERKLPTPPYSPTNSTVSGKRRSRGNSASSPRSSTQAARVLAQPTASTPANPSSNRKMLVEGASEAPSLEGIVDLKDSVDTDVQTHHAPAVIHEKIIPKVHTITEERVDREIHTHDVFHRVQPVIDVQVLPARHYVQSSDGRSLVEIPASAVPGREGHFEVVDTSSKGIKDTGMTAGGIPREQVHHDHAISDPVLTSSKNYVTSEGYTKTESVVRHPPTLETGGYETGQTVPMLMNCLPSERARHETNAKQDSVPRRRHGSRDEAGLLYKNTGYGEQGMLLGLVERGPTTGYNSNESVGEATSFLRRKKEEKRRSMDSRRSLEARMGDLNLGK